MKFGMYLLSNSGVISILYKPRSEESYFLKRKYSDFFQKNIYIFFNDFVFSYHQ